MPLFQRLEQEHGSVIRGLKAVGSESDSQGARYNLFFSLKRGFGSLVEELCRQLPSSSLRPSSRVDSLACLEDGKGWELSVRSAGKERFDAVVLAMPAPASGNLLSPSFPELAAELSSIRYRGAITVNLAYQRDDYLSVVPSSYGFVVPTRERRPLLACTFSSRKWPQRGSEKFGLLRTYFGGPNMEWAFSASDEDLVDVSRQQLGELLGFDDSPLETWVRRWPQGLPEYRVGHRQKVQNIRSALETCPGLALAGNFLDGVGLPDCVRLGRRAVSQLSSA